MVLQLLFWNLRLVPTLFEGEGVVYTGVQRIVLRVRFVKTWILKDPVLYNVPTINTTETLKLLNII